MPSRFHQRIRGDPLQRKVFEILSYGNDTPRTAASWSPFVEEDTVALRELTSSYFKISRETKITPVKAVLEQAEKDVRVKDPQLVHNAVMTFINTHPEARRHKLRVPPLIRRAPNRAVPRRPGATQGVIPIVPIPQEPTKETSPEDALSYWRDDPNLNEHHDHWHNIYGKAKLEDDNGVYWKNRQGELFVYMHRQMVARYEAERISNGLPEVKEYRDYTEVIPEHYYPNEDLSVTSNNRVVTFSARQSGGVMKNGFDRTDRNGNVMKGTTVDELAANRDLLEKVIKQGYFDDLKDTKSIKTADNPDLLGIAIEMGITSETYKDYDAELWGSKYPAFHNFGHVLLSQVGITDSSQPAGVIGTLATACRDPLFYRWHTYVDNLYTMHQCILGPNNFGSNDVPVKISSDGIFLVFKDKIANATPQNIATVASQFAETIKSQKPTNATNVLETKMKARPFEWKEGGEEDGKVLGTTIIEYLFPREWYYFFRVENPTSQDVKVTFRVFIVPEAFKNKHNRYIEVDKFQQILPANKVTVVARDCDKSSVVAQPPKKTAEDLDDNADVPDDEEFQEFCDCGWPYHLVLPRGNREGLPFKLVVFITDGSDKAESAKECCGSLSFCGAKDPRGDYPDTRDMGYPFNRPFKNDSVEEAFRGLKYAAIKDIKIKLVDDFVEFTK
ncbi:7681_t:CDS:2 [Acaulospora colombiana]|uniref:7681_t:CDS:1 n=1 Tax=Acaulospora colombiana TaxID=27376 RepID=A0ACA9LXZ4_9GLOM|nr:7681_t:CDS:2 [Acaulospora colombiana]